ncbi:MAG TPA: hypothetical protein VJ020_12470, partial [Anaerolineales bacterium]|nr:hypothetical protein [Anaerolineales bacterium]
MRYGNIVVNILTVMILLATCGAFGLVAALSVNPYLIPFNPYQPPTPVAILVLPSATATSTTSLFPTFPATFTATATITATRFATETPAPTLVTEVTLEATETPTETHTPDPTQIALLTQGAITATNTPPASNTPTVTPTASKTRSAFPFTVQGGGPTPIQNFANSAGCNWMGIGG